MRVKPTTYQKVGVGIEVCDPIHGKFLLEPPFSDIIETQEMRRLDNLMQLGFAYLYFHRSYHNRRLGHCVGAFHNSDDGFRIIKEVFAKNGITLLDEEILVVRLALLVHDIGHAPFSHVTERVLSYSHEKRTIDILLGDTEINRVISQNFGSDMPAKVASFIVDLSNIQCYDEINKKNCESKFFRFNKLLVSGQIDFDRLDFLVRDAYYTDTPSSISYKRIFNALTIIVDSNGDYHAGAKWSNLGAIETPLIERGQHYRDIYFIHEVLLLEQNYINIFEILKVTKEQKVLEIAPHEIKEIILHNSHLETKEFLNFSEKMILDFFEGASKITDNPVLKKLLDMKNFLKNTIIIRNLLVGEKLRKELMKHFNIKDELLKYVVFESSAKAKIYKKSEGFPIVSDNEICDIGDLNSLIKVDECIIVNASCVNMAALHAILCKSGRKISMKELKSKVESIVAKTVKPEEEFELKYLVQGDAKSIMSGVIETLLASGYGIEKSKEVLNRDKYYDTTDFQMFKENKTLRRRDIADTAEVTFKQARGKGTVYANRDEINVSIDKKSTFSDMISLISQNPKVGFALSSVSSIIALEVVNNRTEYVIKKENARFCMSLDCAKYKREGNEVSDVMIEIESIGSINDRLLLNEINAIINVFISEKNLSLELTQESKYHRGMRLLCNIN